MARKSLILVAGVWMMLSTACAHVTKDPSASGQGQLVVFAASSLTKAFTEIGSGFEAEDPGVRVTFNFASSSELAGQIESQGVADVFASASEAWMGDVASKIGVTGRVDLARNRLVIIVPPSNPAGISSISDLARPGVQLVLAAKGVPVGDYARQALANAGIGETAEANVVSNELDDASVVGKVTSGEADAAIVYTSDVSGPVAANVTAVPIPVGDNVTATYPIAVMRSSSNADLASRFVGYATGLRGQATLVSFGFLPPDGEASP